MVPMIDEDHLSGRSSNSIQCECNNYSSSCGGNDEPFPQNDRLKKFEELQKRRLQLKARTEAIENKRELRKRKRYERKQAVLNNQEMLIDTTSNVETDTKFSNVKKYLDVNSHLVGAVCHNIDEPKSHMEERMNDAITDLDLEAADALSDGLAQREFACRLHGAFEAKKFADAKEKEAEIVKAKKIKKLHWGFDAKQRWEMKGNL